MALDRTVKIKSVDNLSVARLAAGMGVDYIGISYAKLCAPGFLNEAAGIAEWLSGPELVLELDTTDYDPAQVEGFLAQIPFAGLDAPVTSYAEQYSKPILFLRHHFTEEAVGEDLKKDYSRALGRDARLILEAPDEQKLANLSKELENYLNHESLMLSADFRFDRLEEIADRHLDLAVELIGTRELQPGVLRDNGLAEMLELLEND